MTKPTSHAKGVKPEGTVKAPSPNPSFQKAAKGQSPTAGVSKTPEPKPAPQQHLRPQTPGGQAVTKQTSETQMAKFSAERKQAADVKTLKNRANSIRSRNATKAHDKIKSKDDLQK